MRHSAWLVVVAGLGLVVPAGADTKAPSSSEAVLALAKVCREQGKPAPALAVDRGRGFKLIIDGGSATERSELTATLAAAVNRKVLHFVLPDVVSKWIGETEKNLSVIFQRAEESGAILVFDEADELFGKGSEPRDGGVDSYAVALELLRKHDGIVVFGTTLKENERSDAAMRVHRLVKGTARRAELWNAICS